MLQKHKDFFRGHLEKVIHGFLQDNFKVDKCIFSIFLELI